MKATFYVADGPDYLGNNIFTAQVFSNGLKNYFFLFAELRRQLAARHISLDTQDITLNVYYKLLYLRLLPLSFITIFGN